MQSLSNPQVKQEHRHEHNGGQLVVGTSSNKHGDIADAEGETKGSGRTWPWCYSVRGVGQLKTFERAALWMHIRRHKVFRVAKIFQSMRESSKWKSCSDKKSHPYFDTLLQQVFGHPQIVQSHKSRRYKAVASVLKCQGH